MIPKFFLGALLALSLALGQTAMAHSDMEIGADAACVAAPCTANLVVEYDFSKTVRASFAASLDGDSLYTTEDPGFSPVEEEEDDLYPILNGTVITLTVTAIEGNVSLKFGPTLLDDVNDSLQLGIAGVEDGGPNDLHRHPDYQLQLRLPAGEYGEGKISFQLSADNGYGTSPSYTLHVTNGYLTGVTYDSEAEDKRSLACQRVIGSSTRAFLNTRHLALTKCLDAVQVAKARGALSPAPGNLAAAVARAEKECVDAAASSPGPDSKTMLGRMALARARALGSIKKACGGTGKGSGDYTEDNDILANLGFLSCQSDRVISSTYGLAKEDLANYAVRASQGGRCVGGTDAGAPCGLPDTYACAGGGICENSLDLFLPCLIGQYAGEEEEE